MRKRDDAYRQWVEYEDARREGRPVRQATIVREPVKPARLISQNRYPQLELGDIRAAGTGGGVISANQPVSGLGLTIRSDLRSGGDVSDAGADHVEGGKPRGLSQIELDALYGDGINNSKLRDLDRHSLAEKGEGQVDESGDESRAGTKKTSIFSKFNPLVLGRMSTEKKIKAKPLTAAMMGGTVNNPLASNKRPFQAESEFGIPSHFAQHSSRRLQFVSTPAPPDGLPPGLSTPTQSPDLVAALDSIQLETTEFNDDDDDDDDNGEGEEGEEGEGWHDAEERPRT
jgi:hypothetical protein